MDEVLWHSTTFLLAKSIFVKMPKLPTIRVIGSQDISTIFSGCARVSFTGTVAVDISYLLLLAEVGERPPADWSGVTIMFGRVASSQLGARMTPTWLFVCRTLCDLAERLNNANSNPENCGRVQR